MVAIECRELPVEEIDKIKYLWEKIRRHHQERATNFKSDFEKATFEERKKKIATCKKALKIIVAEECDTQSIVGYCISSLSREDCGEIDSIYIDREFRRLGIGRELMNRSLTWFEENGINDIIISVALGNEEALPFYHKFGFAPRTYVLKKIPV